jgi:hypothetical protein
VQDQGHDWPESGNQGSDTFRGRSEFAVEQDFHQDVGSGGDDCHEREDSSGMGEAANEECSEQEQADAEGKRRGLEQQRWLIPPEEDDRSFHHEHCSTGDGGNATPLDQA